MPENYYRINGYNYYIEKKNTYSIVTDKISQNKTYCALCSRLRRGILYSEAARLGANKLAEIACDVKTYIPFLIVLFIIGLLLNYKRTLYWTFALIVLLCFSELADSYFKHSAGRMRPGVAMLLYSNPSAYSWPSAHAWNTMCLAFYAGTFNKRIKKYLIFLSMIIGASRVIANYHFPLDVVSGWILGGAFGFLISIFHMKLNEIFSYYKQYEYFRYRSFL